MNANLVDINTLSKFFGRDPEIIQQWIKDGMPEENNKKFDFVKCVKWRIDKLELENDLIQNQIKDQVVTTEALAKYFDVNVRTIQRYAESKNLPRIGENRFPLLKSLEWFANKLKEDLKKYATDNPLTKEKLKQVTLSNLSTIMDLREKAKQLVPVSNVKNVIGYFKSTVNSSLDAYIEDIITMLKPDLDINKERKIRESHNELKRLLASLSIKDKLERDEALLDDDWILKVKLNQDGNDSTDTE